MNTIISTRPATRHHFFGYCTSWNFTYLGSIVDFSVECHFLAVTAAVVVF